MGSRKELMDNLRVEGIKVDQALERFCYDEDFFCKMLMDFMEANEIETVNKYVELKNYDEAFEHALNVQSLTGSFGIEKAYQKAMQMCEHFSKQEYEEVSQDISIIRDNFRKLFYCIQKYKVEELLESKN